MSVAIVGAGNSGHEAAIEMAGVASRVTLVSTGDLSGDAILQDKVSADARIEILVVELLESNHRGEIEVDGKGHTGTQGIFAAGDVTDDQSKQIVIAAGSGASAALGAFEYLVSQV
jgi:alkyl hydroperoxide reductase subunit F